MDTQNQFALHVVTEGMPDQHLVLDHFPFTLGRLADRDCVVADKSVSREHAMIVLEDDALVLVDQSSRFGTFVNGERVERRVVHPGDIIQLGSDLGPTLRMVREGGEAGSSASGILPDLKVLTKTGSDFERLKWFLAAARRLNEFGAIDEILVSLVEITLQLTKVERGFVFLNDGEGGMRLAVGRTLNGPVLEDDSNISRSAIQQAILGQSKFIVTDTLSAESQMTSESMVVHNIRSVICIPLRRRSADAGSAAETMGVLYLDSRLHAGRLTLVEHDLLETIAKEAAALVENAYLVESEVAARKYRTELGIAAQIQQGLMKVQMPKLPYVEFAARSIPCLEIGGDFYDVIEAHGSLYVIIADISGKGISAALLASTLQGMLYALVMAESPLPEIASVANQFLFAKDVGKYATMVMARVMQDGVVEYMNCGHVKPLVVSGDQVVKLQASNLVVGLLPSVAYESSRYQMQHGDRLLLVTDGVTEAENVEGDFYGDEALEAAVKLPSVEAILSEVQAFMGSAPSSDDCTIVEVRYGEAQPVVS